MIPKAFEKRRDELYAAEFCVCCNHYEEAYKKGFIACYEILLPLIEKLKVMQDEEFYWVYEPHRDENNKFHPGLMKNIHEIRSYVKEVLTKSVIGEK